MKILVRNAAGLLGGYISPWICTHIYEKIRNYRKAVTYLSKALLKMAGGGASPTPPPLDPLLALGMLLNVCLLVLRLLFFEQGPPMAKSINMVWGPHIARVKTKIY